jgi:hypothetical protein
MREGEEKEMMEFQTKTAKQTPAGENGKEDGGKKDVSDKCDLNRGVRY